MTTNNVKLLVRSCDKTYREEEIKNATEKRDRGKEERISMDIIDPILDKIIEYGYESLTEESITNIEDSTFIDYVTQIF